MVCVSAATPGFPAAMDLCRRVRNAGRTTVVGGVHASFMYPEFLPSGAVDFAVVGEGEETLPELLRCLAAGDDPARVAGIAFGLGGRVIRTAPRPRLAALDPLPKAWDLLPLSRYRWAGRPRVAHGGHHHVARMPPPLRLLLPGDPVRGHVAHALRGLGGLRAGPAPAGARGRAGVLLRPRARRRRRPLRRADRAARRARSRARARDLEQRRRHPPRRGSAPALARGRGDPRRDLPRAVGGSARRGREERAVADGRRAVRALRRAGITCETSFWLGFPDETPATVEETLARARAWDPDIAHFPLLTPLPYTPAWRTYGAHVITRDYRRYNQRDPVVKPREMELQRGGGGRRAVPPAVHRRPPVAERLRARGAAPGPGSCTPGSPSPRAAGSRGPRPATDGTATPSSPPGRRN